MFSMWSSRHGTLTVINYLLGPRLGISCFFFCLFFFRGGLFVFNYFHCFFFFFMCLAYVNAKTLEQTYSMYFFWKSFYKDLEDRWLLQNMVDEPVLNA